MNGAYPEDKKDLFFIEIHSENVSLNTFIFHGCRKLYWSDRGTNSGLPPKIASANMDGKSPRTLFTGSLENVAFITLDIEEQKLYWAVSSTGVVCAPF